jgi:succinyl-CoA synthetase beta subunit
MKLYEYAAKEIFSRYKIPVPECSLVHNAADAGEAAGKMGDVVIKAQVLTGGRGKAGGIARAKNQKEAVSNAERILGMSIKGYPVKNLLVEKYTEPIKEMYLGITIDRKAKCPVIMTCPEGGIDIEEIARSYPEKITRMHIHPLAGIHDYQARNLANSLDEQRASGIADIIKKLYRVFTDNDCQLAEINPLADTKDGIFALDAKMIIDDNALFRQGFLEEETGSLEEIAKKNGMSYVDLEGDIGCIVNGAGLAMATLDMVTNYGGKPANFMDVRAGANEEQVRTALRIVSSKKIKAILINIFGGLTKCDEVAKGIIDVFPEKRVPLVVRLAGTNEDKGRAILEEYGIALANSTEEASKRVVELGNSHK